MSRALPRPWTAALGLCVLLAGSVYAPQAMIPGFSAGLRQGPLRLTVGLTKALDRL